VCIWAFHHDGREVGVDACGEVPAHAQSSPISVGSTKHDEVWIAEAIVEGVMKLDLYPNDSFEQDPLHIWWEDWM
jgi:hypothetical protein